jgi:hypothetical protein
MRLALPGDDLVKDSDLTATRAITVHTGAKEDLLENLAGCKMHSADRIVPEWQSVRVGSKVNLHPEVAYDVAISDPGRALVLRGGVPMGKVPAPYDSTWAFTLDESVEGATRLVVRERYGYTRWWAALLIEPTALISFFMSRRMLRGIKARAERTVVCP